MWSILKIDFSYLRQYLELWKVIICKTTTLALVFENINIFPGNSIEWKNFPETHSELLFETPCSLKHIWSNKVLILFTTYRASPKKGNNAFQESYSILLSSQEIYSCSQKFEASPVVLHIITFHSSKYCLRYVNM